MKVTRRQLKVLIESILKEENERVYKEYRSAKNLHYRRSDKSKYGWEAKDPDSDKPEQKEWRTLEEWPGSGKADWASNIESTAKKADGGDERYQANPPAFQ